MTIESKELKAWTALYFYFTEYFISGEYLGLCNMISDMDNAGLITDHDAHYLKVEIKQDIYKMSDGCNKSSWLYDVKLYQPRLDYLKDKIAKIKRRDQDMWSAW